MTRIMLAANAAHDLATEYLDTWSDKVVAFAAAYPDVTIVNLKKDKANKLDFEKYLKEKQPRLVVIHGHGGEDRVLGYQYEVLVRCDLNPEILKNKIVHALACQSGKKLAPKCIELGTTTYIGYKEDFQLVTLGKTTSLERSQDIVAALFLDPAFEVVVALIQGATVEEAFKRSQIKYRESLIPLLTSAGQSAQIANVASLLAYNFQHQICIGDKTAKF